MSRVSKTDCEKHRLTLDSVAVSTKLFVTLLCSQLVSNVMHSMYIIIHRV